MKKYETSCEREKLHCAMKLQKVHTLVAKEVLYWKILGCIKRRGKHALTGSMFPTG